jgi:hypothetical protein
MVYNCTNNSGYGVFVFLLDIIRQGDICSVRLSGCGAAAVLHEPQRRTLLGRRVILDLVHQAADDEDPVASLLRLVQVRWLVGCQVELRSPVADRQLDPRLVDGEVQLDGMVRLPVLACLITFAHASERARPRLRTSVSEKPAARACVLTHCRARVISWTRLSRARSAWSVICFSLAL